MFAPAGMHYILLVNGEFYAEGKNFDMLLHLACEIGRCHQYKIKLYCVDD